MYEDLVKSLRICAVDGSCRTCPRFLICNNDEEEHVLDGLFNDAADAIEELTRENESLAKSVNEASDILRRRWIPVAERLPEYGTPVLAYGSRGGIFVAKYERARADWDRDYWWKLNSSIHVCNPTHWMPLSEPPKEET